MCDVIPNPPRTGFVVESLARGCTVLDGLGMLVNQGAIAIKLWSGHAPDRGVMRRALRQSFLDRCRSRRRLIARTVLGSTRRTASSFASCR